jgi:hypothetical protein
MTVLSTLNRVKRRKKTKKQRKNENWKKRAANLRFLSGAEPVYNPEKYNQNPRVQETHNCWSYSMDVIDPLQLTQCDHGAAEKHCNIMYHQPGGTKGLSKQLHTREGRSCSVVEDLVEADISGVRKSTIDETCPHGTSKIALVVHPGEDYHFYRQDADGLWSHKDGSNKVKRYDAEGNIITNPETAARNYRPNGSFLHYKDFCGFYCVPRTKPIHLARGGSRTGRRNRGRRVTKKRVRGIQNT